MMDAKQAIEKLHIIELLAPCELEARYMREIIELIERQDKAIVERDAVIARMEDRLVEARGWEAK